MSEAVPKVVPDDSPSIPPRGLSRLSVLGAWLAGQRRMSRLYDGLVLVWLGFFHQVLGAKYRFAQIAYDEHYFLNEGWSVLKGQVPYRDFQEFKPPVIFFVNALGIQLFGLENLAYRQFFSLLSLASFFALVVALLSRKTNRLLVVGVLMLLIDHFYDDGLHNAVINNSETPALDFFMLGVGVLLTRTKWERTQQVVGGALLALSPLSKEPMAFAVVAAWLSLLLLHRIESGSKQAVKRFALFTVVGVVAVALIWLGYMLATDSLRWYILQLELNFAYTEKYAYQVRWASHSPRGGRLVEAFTKLWRGYVNSDHLAVFIPLVVALFTLSRQRWLLGTAALVTFAASLYGVSIGSGYAARYFIMAMTGTFFCVVLGTMTLDDYAKRAGRDTVRWVAATWVGLALVMTWPRFATEWKKYDRYAAPKPPVPQSDIDFVHKYTSPGDKIWTTDDPLLYVFSNRESAFLGGIVLDEIIEYYPGKTDKERLSIVREGLEKHRPKLVVLGNSQVSAGRKRRYTKALVRPFLRDGGYIRLNRRFYLRPD